jgi:hypothetical protein
VVCFMPRLSRVNITESIVWCNVWLVMTSLHEDTTNMSTKVYDPAGRDGVYFGREVPTLQRKVLQPSITYIYSPTNVQFNHINCAITLSYMFRTLNLGSSSGTHYLKSHTIYTNWYNCLHSSSITLLFWTCK